MKSYQVENLKKTLNLILDQCRLIIQTNKNFRSWTKNTPKGSNEIVTSVDIEIEAALSSQLLKEYPTASILGEEKHTDANALKADLCFIIDPIDGTKEFLAGRSTYAISVAVLQAGGLEVGVLDFPSQRLRFWSEKGQGATVNDSDIHVTTEHRLDKLKIGVSPMQAQSACFNTVKDQLKTSAFIPMGTLTAKVCAVAKGDFDAAFYLGGPDQMFPLWDFAACGLVLAEAGGRFTSLDGSEILTTLPILSNTGWLATNGHCHQMMLNLLGKD